MKTGDFSSILARRHRYGSGNRIDPSTRARSTIRCRPSTTRAASRFRGRRFPGNMIPQSRLDPAFAKILQLYPGHQPADQDRHLSRQTTISTSRRARRSPIRATAGSTTTSATKTACSARMSWANTSKTSGAPFPGALDGTRFQRRGRNRPQPQRPDELHARLDPDADFGNPRRLHAPGDVARRRQPGRGPVQAVRNRRLQSHHGLQPTTAVFRRSASATAIPQIGANDWIPTKEYNNVWDFIQNVAINKGSHAIKFGAEFRPIKFPFFQVPDPHGNIELQRRTKPRSRSTTKGSHWRRRSTPSTGDPIASALLGQMDSGNISTTNFISSQKVAWAGYAQDDWKVIAEADGQSRPALRAVVADRREVRPAGKFRSAEHDALHPQGPNQDLPLPPNFAAAFPNCQGVSRRSVQAPDSLGQIGLRSAYRHRLSGRTKRP